VKFEDVEFNEGFFMHSDFRGSTFVRGNIADKKIPNSEASAF